MIAIKMVVFVSLVNKKNFSAHFIHPSIKNEKLVKENE